MAARTGEVLIAGKSAKIARGIAKIGHGNIADRGKQIPRDAWCDGSKGRFHSARLHARPDMGPRPMVTQAEAAALVQPVG